jgi:hypothetical protein
MPFHLLQLFTIYHENRKSVRYKSRVSQQAIYQSEINERRMSLKSEVD